MVSGLFLYGQGSLSDDDVVANFVARGDTLDSLLRRLRAIEPDGLATHHLLIGVRGMGKTTLLRRLAIAIDQDPALAQRFTPLSFREEQYNVLSLGDFWRNCGEALAEWAERTGKDALAQRLDRALFTPDWAGDEDAADRFQAEMEQVGRRAVLLVDNLDLILDALPDADQWILRRRLQARHGPVIVGASTRPLRQTADRDAAFYEFFQPFHLEPLNQRETEDCMRALAQGRGAAGGAVIRSLNTQPERLRTLHTLTGGNPRILTLIYRLLENSESDQAMADLEVLLDQVTPFYKARVEDYQTAQQRAVIDAIALHWDPITTTTLAQITNIPATTLSPLLIKLRKDGLIESRETSGSYAGHQLVERFLNIWYLMRHGTRRAKQKMRWLVGFLTSFYSAHELSDIAQRARMASAAKPLHPDYEVALQEAVARSSAMERDGVSRWDAALADQTASITRKVDERGVDDTLRREALALRQEAYSFWESGDFLRCLATLNRLLEHFGEDENPGMLAEVTKTMAFKGVTLSHMGDEAGAIAAYDTLLDRFAEDEDPAMRELVAITMGHKGAMLGAMGDAVGEITAYDALLARFGEVEDSALREPVAKAMVSKGIRLGKMGDTAGAIAAYDALLARFGEAEDPALRDEIAKAQFNKGGTLGKMGDAAGAIAAYDALLARLAEEEDPAMRELVATAMFNKGITLGMMGNTAEAITTLDAMLTRFGEDEDPTLRELVATALRNKGVTLREMGDAAGGIAVYDAMLARFGEDEDPAMRELVATALFDKGFSLGKMGDAAGAIAAYDAMLARFGEDKDPAIRELVATALRNRGITLGEMGDAAGAIAAYDAMLARFGEDKDPAIRELVATAMLNKGFTLGMMGKAAEAIAALDPILARFGEAEDPAMHKQVAFAMLAKGSMLSMMGNVAEEISTYERLHALVGENENIMPATLLSRSRIKLANFFLDLQGDSLRAEKLYRDTVVFEPISANLNLAWLLLLTGRTAEAQALRASLEALPPSGLALLDAAIELAQDNFGTATAHLTAALDGGLEHEGMTFSDDLERLLRLAEQTGYGERLLGWFEASGAADRVAPVYAAFKAYVRGEAMLLDVNPEVGRPARVIYDRLDAPRRNQRPAAPPSKPKRPRGRPRKA